MLKPSLTTNMTAVRERIVGVRQHVPTLNGETRTYVNFDNAASTPVLQDVLDTVNAFMHWYSSVHRGTGFKSRVATQAYDDAREIVARWFELHLLEAMGFRPELAQCLDCGIEIEPDGNDA